MSASGSALPLAVAVLSARFIWAWVTPGTDNSAFSILATQEAQVAPETDNAIWSSSAVLDACGRSAAGSAGVWSTLDVLLPEEVFFEAQQEAGSDLAKGSAGYPVSVTTRAASTRSTPSGKATVCASISTSTSSVLPVIGSRAVRIFLAQPWQVAPEIDSAGFNSGASLMILTPRNKTRQRDRPSAQSTDKWYAHPASRPASPARPTTPKSSARATAATPQSPAPPPPTAAETRPEPSGRANDDHRPGPESAESPAVKTPTAVLYGQTAAGADLRHRTAGSCCPGCGWVVTDPPWCRTGRYRGLRWRRWPVL